MAHSDQRCSRFLRCAQATHCPSDGSGARLPAHQVPNNQDSHRNSSDVTDPTSIRAAAVKFIERFGVDAKNQASIRAGELLLVGNYQGRTRWQLIGREIEHLLEDGEISQKSALN
ncbi:MAG: hypothetical protein HOG95_03070 [Rhodospirillaceae bacterium]|jgi:hypothetical protein|nr:hypothetical protein [Rhodospirillaceae bacterium]